MEVTEETREKFRKIRGELKMWDEEKALNEAKEDKKFVRAFASAAKTGEFSVAQSAIVSEWIKMDGRKVDAEIAAVIRHYQKLVALCAKRLGFGTKRAAKGRFVLATREQLEKQIFCLNPPQTG